MALHRALVVAASRRPAFPTARDLLLLRVAANQTGIGLEAARLMEAEKRRSVQLAKLAAAALEINSGRALDDILRRITDCARDVIGAHQAVTSLTTGPDFAQAITAVSLSDRYAARREADAPADGWGLHRLVCETNQPMRLTARELERHPARRGSAAEAVRRPPLRGWLAAPIVARDGRNMGVIQVADKIDGDFDESDERIAVQLAQMAAVAIESARLNEDLRRSRAAAIEADRRKDEFLAMLGHELRNPLAPILTALDLMQLRGGGGEREREVIERQVRHVARLVDDLLDVSRITQGKIQLRRARVEVAAVVAKAIEVATPLLELRQHDLQVDVSDEGLVVDGDPLRLAQIVGNLLTNAAKYTDPRGRIRVAARRAGDRVRVVVADNGIGIASGALPHIFDMFVQGQRSIDRADGGLGLGLALVRALVTLHGGTVEARSDGPGRGSEFTVTLPAAPAAAPDEARGEDREARSAASGGPSRRILLVDDNEDAREMLADALGMLGHEVACAGDGPQALALAAAEDYGVALLDIGLPVMDGYELARRLRKLKGASLRLVAITGYGLERDRRNAAAAGFDAHLVKPIDVRALDATIRGDASKTGG
jgi:signal transduction histidine kinase/ActR/RegA family two-component response regulator